MVHTHSLSRSINVQNCAGVAQISNVAELPRSFLPHIGKAASASSIAGSHKFQLLISLGQYSGDDSLNIILVLVQFLLEDLIASWLTLGMVSEENSETWLPPCPSKIPKSPDPSPLKLSWDMQSK